MRLGIIFCLLFFTMNSFAQIDTTVSLVSKIDAFPQFELYDGNQIYMMGYTTTIGGAIKAPSPTLNFKEGDSVRIDMWNLSQGPPHTIHLHGLDVNQENDGVPALSFAVEHDDTGSYFFKVPHPGTYIYHCHETSVLHVQAGMYGLVIVRPQSADTLTWENGYSFHREYAWMTSEIDTNWQVDSIINHPHDTTATTHLILDYNPQHFLVNGMSEHQLDNSSAEIVGGEGDTYYFHKEGMIDLLLNDGEPTEFTGSWSITGNQMTVDTGYDGKKTAAVKIEGKNFIFGDVAFEPL